MDQAETQTWDVRPEHYISTWLEQQRNEDAAKIEQAEARKQEEELAKMKQDELRLRMRRREQLETSLRLDTAEDVGKPATELELVCMQH